jgi:hypothetical protein
MALGACAAPLDTARLNTLPVVEFGQPVPRAGDYVLHFPAGKAIATDVAIGGNLFKQPAREVLRVKLKRDLYSYKKWVSFDRQHWLPSRDALAFKLDIKIPSYKFPQPGHIRLDLSEKSADKQAR